MLLGHTFRAFRHRDFRIFWFGLFLGHTGALFQSTAQGWLIFELTDSAFYLGLDGLCLGLPRIIFSAFGGVVVDRTDRVWCQALGPDHPAVATSLENIAELYRKTGREEAAEALAKRAATSRAIQR